MSYRSSLWTFLLGLGGAGAAQAWHAPPRGTSTRCGQGAVGAAAVSSRGSRGGARGPPGRLSRASAQKRVLRSISQNVSISHGRFLATRGVSESLVSAVLSTFSRALPRVLPALRVGAPGTASLYFGHVWRRLGGYFVLLPALPHGQCASSLRFLWLHSGPARQPAALAFHCLETVVEVIHSLISPWSACTWGKLDQDH